MIKLTFCLHRLPHLSREAFQDYWLNTHGPLVKSVAGLLRIQRYVQLHAADAALSADIRGSRNGPEQYDGVAQLWWQSWDDLAASSTDEGRTAGRMLLEDEQKFIDLPRSPLWWGEEKVIVG